MRSLVQVQLAELRALHHALTAGRVPWPLRASSLQADGLGHHAPLLLAALGDLDRVGVLALLSTQPSSCASCSRAPAHRS